jgi:hypothetical protein
MTTGNFCFHLENRLIQTKSKQEVNETVILPHLVLPALKGGLLALWNNSTISRLGWNLLKVTAQHTSLLVQKIITRVKSFMIKATYYFFKSTFCTCFDFRLCFTCLFAFVIFHWTFLF